MVIGRVVLTRHYILLSQLPYSSDRSHFLLSVHFSAYCLNLCWKAGPILHTVDYLTVSHRKWSALITWKILFFVVLLSMKMQYVFFVDDWLRLSFLVHHETPFFCIFLAFWVPRLCASHFLISYWFLLVHVFSFSAICQIGIICINMFLPLHFTLTFLISPIILF